MGGPGTGVGGLGDENPHPLTLSGSVWSSYRKSCVDMVMKWLVPESSGRYVNRMTNEALHKGGPREPMAVRTAVPTLVPGLEQVLVPGCS